MREHESIECLQAAVAILRLARRLFDQGMLEMHHLVMAEHKHIVFKESIVCSVRQFIVVPSAENRIMGNIAHHFIHPAHIPLEFKAKTAVFHRICDSRLDGRILRDEIAGCSGADRLIYLLQESFTLQVDVSAKLIRPPFRAAEAGINHGRHSVDTQCVNMELLNPVKCTGDQE